RAHERHSCLAPDSGGSHAHVQPAQGVPSLLQGPPCPAGWRGADRQATQGGHPHRGAAIAPRWVPDSRYGPYHVPGTVSGLSERFPRPSHSAPGTRVTIVGEVTGATTLALDETDYSYPTLEIKNLRVWPQSVGSSAWPRPYVAPYYW